VTSPCILQFYSCVESVLQQQVDETSKLLD